MQDKKNPILCTTKSILVYLFETRYAGVIDCDPKRFVEDLYKTLKSYPPNDFLRATINAKTVRKLKKTTMDLSSADLFNEILYQERLALKHRVTKIKKGPNKNYEYVKSFAKLAEDFCKDYSLDKKPGFRFYIKTGLEFIKTKYGYNLHMFRGADVRIRARIEAKNLLLTKDQKKIVEAYEIFAEQIIVNFDITAEDFQATYPFEVPESMLKFLYLVEACDKRDADLKCWILSNFEGLKFTNSIPLIQQMYSEKSFTRWRNHRHKFGFLPKTKQVKIKADLKSYTE